MSFWDNYTSTAEGGKYINADEKQVLIDQGVIFSIKALTKDLENQYGPRYVSFVTIPPAAEGEEELEAKISFPLESGVDSRDSMLRNMEDYFDKEDSQPVKVKLTKVGRAIHIVPGE